MPPVAIEVCSTLTRRHFNQPASTDGQQHTRWQKHTPADRQTHTHTRTHMHTLPPALRPMHACTHTTEWPHKPHCNFSSLTSFCHTQQNEPNWGAHERKSFWTLAPVQRRHLHHIDLTSCVHLPPGSSFQYGWLGLFVFNKDREKTLTARGKSERLTLNYADRSIILTANYKKWRSETSGVTRLKNLMIWQNTPITRDSTSTWTTIELIAIYSGNWLFDLKCECLVSSGQNRILRTSRWLLEINIFSQFTDIL